MPIAIIDVSLYPNVPVLPGVPFLLRSPFFPPSPAPTLMPSQQSSLVQSVGQTAAWGIFDSDLNQVLFPDSVIDFDYRAEYRVANFPVQQGKFASYNKVVRPFDNAVRMTKGGGVGDRAQFLSQLDQIAASLSLYTILTPEKSYPNVNVTRVEMSRKGVEGAYFLAVDVFFVQIQQVTPQYTMSAAATQNASIPAALPPVSNGLVQPTPPSAAVAAGGAQAIAQSLQ